MIVIPTDLTNSSLDGIVKTLRLMSFQDLKICIIHYFEPIKASQSSIIKIEDLVYREKVKQLNNFIDQIRLSYPELKDAQIFGKVRYGDFSMCHQEHVQPDDIVVLSNSIMLDQILYSWNNFAKTNLLVINETKAEITFASKLQKYRRTELLKNLSSKMENPKIQVRNTYI